MKSHSALFFLAVAFAAAGCQANHNSTETQTDTIDSVCLDEPSDSTPAVANIPFEVKEYEKSKGDNVLKIQYPVSGNPELLHSVRSWINEQLTDTYRGNLEDASAFFNHYAAQLGQDPDLNEFGGYTIDEFEEGYTDNLVITYQYTTYMYEGGAHGLGGTYGTTFLQSDGSIFTKKCFTSYRPLQKLFVEGLKRYFKVKTNDELMGCLLNVNSISSIAPPGRDPWIEEDGVVFSYSPYEIAPYSAGSPRFTIPYDQIKPYLTEKGKEFFDPE